MNDRSLWFINKTMFQKLAASTVTDTGSFRPENNIRNPAGHRLQKSLFLGYTILLPSSPLKQKLKA
jgi:hypothetical protein